MGWTIWIKINMGFYLDKKITFLTGNSLFNFFFLHFFFLHFHLLQTIKISTFFTKKEKKKEKYFWNEFFACLLSFHFSWFILSKLGKKKYKKNIFIVTLVCFMISFYPIISFHFFFFIFPVLDALCTYIFNFTFFPSFQNCRN